jgi:hypothetical protein
MSRARSAEFHEARAARNADRRSQYRLKAVGPCAVAGARPGEEVSLFTTAEHIERLVGAGHVELADLPKNQADEQKDAANSGVSLNKRNRRTPTPRKELTDG